MKRSVYFTALAKLLAVAMIAATLLALLPIMNVSAADNVIITLDPGHGGSDPGNQSAIQYGGNDEAYDNWEMTKYAKARLEQYAGVTVYLTRDTLEEYMPGLDTRVQVAKSHNSDAIISIHTNSAENKSAGGIEILVPNMNWRPEVGKASQNCANAILEKYVAEIGVKNRGLKERVGSSTYEDGSAADYFGIIKNGKKQNIPVAMIVETGFASNQEDYLRVLQSDATRMRAGYAIADGIAAYFNLSPKAGADMSMPEVPDIVIPEQPKTIQFHSSIDHVNGKGPNGEPNFAGYGGNTNGGANIIDALSEGVYIRKDGKLTVGGWLGVDGGTARFVYSLDSGETWMDVPKGGYDGEPLPGHYAGLGFTNATKNGMFNNNKSPLTVDLTAYAGDFVDVTFAAVAAADNETIIPFITILSYLVPGEKQTEAPTEPETTTAEPETTTEPEVTTTEPEVTTAEPEVTTTEPEVTTTEPEVTTTEPAATTAAPAEEKGCGSAVSGAMAIIGMTVAAGAAFLARKKKD